MTDVNANLNSTQCLKETMNFGETIVRNICNGSTHAIPWGTMDYVVTIMAVLFFSTILLMFAALAITVIRD